MSRIRLFHAVLAVVTAGLFLSGAAWAAPGPISHWDDSGLTLVASRPVVGGAPSTAGFGLQLGADHIVSQQCGDGGFGWPHADCAATYHNITAPICLGLLEAHATTGDAAHLAAAVAGGAFDLTSTYPNGEARFGSGTPEFLRRLSAVSGDPQYANFASTEFFGELAAGTYGPSDLNTAGWIASVQAGRAGTWVNLLPWEFQTLIVDATALGQAGQDALFLQALLDGLNTLDNTSPATVYSDLLGVSGGVRGLALSGTLTFPAINSPNHAPINGITSLANLTTVLASFQNADGSWYWHSNLPGATVGDEDTQTTAYAVMALVAADPLVAADYSAAITMGRTWLLTMQLASGGFQSWPGGDENTEVEGEALTALAGAAGACCATSGSCANVPESECLVASGTFLGEGSACEGDADADGTDGACGDGCPTDPNKTAPGICGCGVSDGDTDGDSVADCNDGCPADPNKTAPGTCGCGVSDVDTDGDGVADCHDGCPADPNKSAPGTCGCGFSDVDTDGDSVADCQDDCPADPNKLAPGICGCGFSDADTDGDGVADCQDLCPGEDDAVDANANGTPDCLETAIPTVSEWGLIAMVLLLLAGARVYFRRRSMPA